MLFLVLCASVLVIAESVYGYQCGKVASSNIIHQAPWLVLLEYYYRGMEVDIRCGGTLITSRHVVTAAHCVKNRPSIKMAVRLGEYDTKSKIDCVGEICSDNVLSIPVTSIIHPGYDGTEHDIAVLTLEREAPFNDFIRPICLPTGEINETTIFHASGWGEISRGVYSQTTKHIELPFFPEDKCRDAYPTIKLAKNIICAGGKEGIDTCRGDSGGPLTVTRDKEELFGVISAGNTECGTKGKPGIYTSVVDHLDWIVEVISNKQECGVVASDNPIHQHPWLVILEYHLGRHTAAARCGGTLIGKRHILTSAHCVQLAKYPVIMLPRLGEYDTSLRRDCGDRVCSDQICRMVVATFHIHPGFRVGKLDNDLAILVLAAKAPYTDFIRPICLPHGFLDEKTHFYASGFGTTPTTNDQYSHIKKNIHLPYFPHCRRIFRHTYMPPDLICAGGVKHFDTCKGDSGGPLVRIKKKADLWGVTKGGHNPCGLKGIPGVYTSVKYHLKWIKKIVRSTYKRKRKLRRLT